MTMRGRANDQEQAPWYRQRTLYVVVNDHERQRIKGMAKMVALSMRAHLLTAG